MLTYADVCQGGGRKARDVVFEVAKYGLPDMSGLFPAESEVSVDGKIDVLSAADEAGAYADVC